MGQRKRRMGGNESRTRPRKSTCQSTRSTYQPRTYASYAFRAPPTRIPSTPSNRSSFSSTRPTPHTKTTKTRDAPVSNERGRSLDPEPGAGWTRRVSGNDSWTERISRSGRIPSSDVWTRRVPSTTDGAWWVLSDVDRVIPTPGIQSRFGTNVSKPSSDVPTSHFARTGVPNVA
ncbi:hypothetical protein RSOL_355300 [Rhizoctonia solani AG-3 Rhs1AP]|uniref:Uncharacterized protein n=2 Tax=Rhizoctonia solani AG-3 TaxID=1086053 RepID=A0A074SBR8_9AGAM|nr:hypothetical protein RSOL_355300 [Rhizoctonia solani AG-3 Rhs1AP]KEP47462.1 hypothetical protein V565_154990 [Rhizoctonia solani 123E]